MLTMAAWRSGLWQAGERLEFMSAQTNIVRIPTLFANDILQHTNIVHKRHFATFNVFEHGCRQDGCCCLCEEGRHVRRKGRHVCEEREGMWSSPRTRATFVPSSPHHEGYFCPILTWPPHHYTLQCKSSPKVARHQMCAREGKAWEGIIDMCEGNHERG